MQRGMVTLLFPLSYPLTLSTEFKVAVTHVMFSDFAVSSRLGERTKISFLHLAVFVPKEEEIRIFGHSPDNRRRIPPPNPFDDEQ
ncbi:uncharacterized protein MONOS_10204 [Monocercomonoides exilis]|uniref:uncharacterized protein n=1 Tax=Monocercomonoides exilis TaxID=2049356 RepID=UPI00355A5258|nr:hypothetical protein MONOS_10204 [Monocercomonoides exilis]|eukprot:MONOS_10204.1-p1 / transcript=MONOS_10204.1 / gene=MONOS_10204 / organism=Monocercomonoides_exilis_PA203 / gene_product=unspecified product / transcript_product=unspecified product / location=Mono_scaffold00454:4749-5003(-) / protein_length=85 / sequence_SO=supercontig / SO=protein_coding / is_pseudo=false